MITMTKPDVEPASRYSIRQTMSLLGIARSTLQKWTVLGYIDCHYHRIGYRKFYLGRDILRCWNRIA